MYYHGMIPIDIGYMTAAFFKFRGEIIEAIIDSTLFRIPGLKVLAEVLPYP